MAPIADQVRDQLSVQARTMLSVLGQDGPPMHPQKLFFQLV